MIDKDSSTTIVNPTEKQYKILEFIELFTRTKGYAPSIYDLAKMNGTSANDVYAKIIALRRKRYITWDNNVSHSIRIIKHDGVRGKL